MFKALARSALFKTLAGGLVYLAGTFALPTPIWVELLNGVFMGVMFTVAMVYRRIVYRALMGIGPYTRVQQFAVGCAMAWLAILFGRLGSIYFRASGGGQSIPYTDYMTSLTVYTAIWAGIMQITAPGFNEGYMHGRDRVTLLGASLIGLVIAYTTFYIQQAQ